MAFPTGTSIPTTNLSSGTSDPSQARADLLTAVEALNDIIASANDASGVVVLNGSGQVPSGLLPQSITLPESQGVQVINPGYQVVNIRNFLRLQPTTLVDVKAFANSASGDLCYISDYSTGPMLGVYNGSRWVGIGLDTMTIVFLQEAEVAITTQSFFVCEPDL